MISYIEGDIFESPAQVIVNTVNTVGVMGKGLALDYKRRYPNMFDKYRIACEKRNLTIGKLMLFYEPDHWILLFPTKENWRNPSKIEYIEKGLMKFVQTYSAKNISSIAFPKLGCGNGELDWNTVKPIMDSYLRNLPIDVYIYIGKHADDIPEHKEPDKTLKWLKENAKDMSFNGMKDDLIKTCSIVSYAFTAEGNEYCAAYQNGIHFTDSEKKLIAEADENELYIIWDKMRRSGIFCTPRVINKESLIHALLFSLGYTSKIRILDEKKGSMADGYQINAGMERMFSVRG